MDKVSINGAIKAIIKDSLLKIKDMESVRCIGIKNPFIEESGKRGFSQERAKFGKMESW